MCEAEGRKREECFLLMTGALLFIGLGVSAEFCGLGGQVMSALETSLVSVIRATPPFPLTPFFQETPPCFTFLQSEDVLNGALGHNQVPLPSCS